MTKFFGEIEIGTEFTYTLWNMGNTVFVKTDNNHATIIYSKVFKDKYSLPYEFNYNDLVELIAK